MTNDAVTPWAALIVTAHDPIPLQPPPLQPEKTDPIAGVAVNVTLVPEIKLALHVAPQLMPAGLLVTVPVPVPVFDTDSVYEVKERAVNEPDCEVVMLLPEVKSAGPQVPVGQK